MLNLSRSTEEYKFLENDYYDGESFVYFDIIEVDPVNELITVVVSHQGKITQQTFELYVDFDDDIFFEYGPIQEKIYLEEFTKQGEN